MSEFIPYIALGVSGIGLLLSFYKNNTEAVKQLENRFDKIEKDITILERNQFTPEDRKCLNDSSMKINLFWTVVEKDFPKFLKQDDTPEIDILLKKVEKLGINNISIEEAKEIENKLEEEYQLAIDGEKSGRAMALAFYLVTLKYKLGDVSKGCLL